MSDCDSDVCKMDDKAVGCASLQAYARECAMAGVCVDWRPLTNGVCGQYYLTVIASEQLLSLLFLQTRYHFVPIQVLNVISHKHIKLVVLKWNQHVMEGRSDLKS